MTALNGIFASFSTMLAAKEGLYMQVLIECITLKHGYCGIESISIACVGSVNHMHPMFSLELVL